jgi:outer membrane protein OmpA-like peptidoglycan-associated protein
MRILMIGFIAFFTWSTFSTWFYVCKIKNLCNEPAPVQVDVVSFKPEAIISAPELVIMPPLITVNFTFDKSDFNPDMGTDNYFVKSNAYLEQNSSAILSITGFTDATGSGDYNEALGLRRAQTMKGYFEKKGILAGKIVIASNGERNPVDVNTTVSGRAKNRRADITINN